MSDCSVTHPIARDPCSGAAPSTRGLQSCATLRVTRGQACGAKSPSCFVERRCGDGRSVAADFLICASETPGRCFTKSTREAKHDIHYLTPAELDDLARRITTVPLARYRYNDQIGDDPRLGFLTEDAAGAPFVTADGRAVDLYALLAASIATLQLQEHRLRALEQRVERCAR